MTTLKSAADASPVAGAGASSPASGDAVSTASMDPRGFESHEIAVLREAEADLRDKGLCQGFWTAYHLVLVYACWLELAPASSMRR